MGAWAVAVAVAAAAVAVPAAGKDDKGTGNLRSNAMWSYFDKFCFDVSPDAGEGQGGSVEFTFWLDEDDHDRSVPANFLFYYDSDGAWPRVYENNLDCDERRNASTPTLGSGYIELTNGRYEKISIKQSARPHYWYFAIAGCGSERVKARYEVQFLNQGSSAWSRHFSHDEKGMAELHLTFFLFFCILGAIHIHGVLALYRANVLHPVVRLLTATMMLEVFAVLCLFIHYAVFAGDGIGAPGLEALGSILDMGAQLVFMLLLMLLSRGWTISSNTISDKKPLGIALGVFGVLYMSLFIAEYTLLDPADTVYIYETVPGILILVVRMMTMCWFLFNVRSTYLHESEPSKRAFYTRFGTIYALWFAMLPFIVIIAAALDPWVRAITVETLYLLFNFFSFAILAWLMWPARASEYFKITPPDILSGSANPYDAI